MTSPAETVARAIVVALAYGLVDAGLLALVVALVIRASHASATTRHVLWWLALATSTAVPLATFASSASRVELVAPAGSGVRVHTERVRHARIDSRREPPVAGAAAMPEAPLDPRLAAGAAVRRIAALPYAGETIVAVWLGVALCGLGSLGRSLLALRNVKRGAAPLDERIVRRLRRWRQRARTGRAVELRVSRDVDVPVAVGFLTPTILLPERLVASAEDSLTDLDQIVLHEYAHLDRYDDWTNLLQRVLERTFWLNPFVALFASRIALAREIACDDWVIAQTGHAHRYATCLWKLVESARLPTRTVVAPGALFTPRQITIRIEQLLDSRRNALPRLAPFGALVTGAIAVALLVAQTARAPAIAIDVPAPEAALAQVAQVAQVAPRARPSPVALASPRAVATRAMLLRHVPIEATPDVIAKAVATAMATSRHAEVETRVSRSTTGPNSYADDIGIDVAKRVDDVVRPLEPAIASAIVAEETGDSRGGGLHTCNGCDLHGANLRGRDLRGVRWTGADLHGADLRDADLRDANLNGVDLHGVRLDGADLRGARLTGCDLHDANLTGALFARAHLLGTNLHGATGAADAVSRAESIEGD